jgi:hypothetical protein
MVALKVEKVKEIDHWDPDNTSCRPHVPNQLSSWP